MRTKWIGSGALVVSLLSMPVAAQSPAAGLGDQDISDSFIYLLSRLLVLRQQNLDFNEGFQWNQVVHRKPGEVDWPNPNLDVAYSEAWVAIDESSCAVVTVPKVTGRYFTVHFLNGWGETVANINERVYPKKPSGDFAICLKGSTVKTPAGAQRVLVPAKALRVLARFELGANWDEAIALQRQFKVRPTGKPAIPAVPSVPDFEPPGGSLGVSAFEMAEAALDSEPDINPGMARMQATTREIAKMIKDPKERERVDKVVRGKAMDDFHKELPRVGHGTILNGWALPSTSGAYTIDWLTRTYVNFGGIWANVPAEVIYYKGALDGGNAQLRSDHAYALTFPKDDLPARSARYFWSVIAVDSVNRRVLPNPMKRYLLNNQSKLQYGKDGSLTLYFAPERPKDAPDGNWLPTPKGQDYNLTFRFYGPLGDVANRTYSPPPVRKVGL